MVLSFIWSIDSNLFTAGPFQIKWFTLFVIGGLLIGRQILVSLIKKSGATTGDASALFNYTILSVYIFSRLAYFLTYDPRTILSKPLRLLNPFNWTNGLTFDGANQFSLTGGLIGVIVAVWIFTSIRNKTFHTYFVPTIVFFVIVIFFTSVGNFFQSENYGRPTDSKLGVEFVSKVERNLMKTPCCVMKIPNGPNPLDKVETKVGKTLIHNAIGYHPIIVYLFFAEGATEQMVNEFLIGDVKNTLFDMPELIFEPGNEPLHYTIYEEEKGRYMARIQTIDIARHAVQLYEAFGSLFILIVFYFFLKKKGSNEIISGSLLSGIAIVHLVTLFFHDEADKKLAFLSYDQIVCAAVFVLGLFLVFKRSSSKS